MLKGGGIHWGINLSPHAVCLPGPGAEKQNVGPFKITRQSPFGADAFHLQVGQKPVQRGGYFTDDEFGVAAGRSIDRDEGGHKLQDKYTSYHFAFKT